MKSRRDGLIVDLFAGGGGASAGIEAALGRPIDVAVNHSAIAIAVHELNHPDTRHYETDVFDVDPIEATGGDPVALLWASPDCTHFSVAKGDVPRDQGIRSLAWVVVKWARAVRPRTIVVENVREFQKWGPLGKDGRPDKSREGETFERWTNRLRGFGYRVEWRVLDAAEYGAPTCRKRLFIVARCDGLPIRWPAPTHGDGLEPYRTAAECIDWSIACPSIFERKKPLAEKTLKRIATGIRRYVLDAAEPFIVKVNHGGEAFRGQAVDGPLSTVTATQRSHALAVPTLVQTGYGERKGQSPRVPGLDKPLGTVVAGGAKHALCAALLTKHYGGVVGHELTRPVGAVTGRDHHAITAAHLVKLRGQCTGAALDQPMPTITAGGLHIAEVRALMSKHAPSDGGLFASTTGSVRIDGARYQIADIGMRMLEPHELLRAQFGDFADRYRMDATKKMRGRRVPLSKADRVRLIGNSVVPDVACALVSTLSRADRAAEVA